MNQLSMTFNNMSDTISFELAANGSVNAYVDNTDVLPGPKLIVGDSQVYSVNNSWLGGEAIADFWCCWFDPATRARFGVRITSTGQSFGFGDQPTWQVMADVADIDAEPSWTPSGGDPAAQYEWDESVGFHIRASPIAGHETLNITIIVSDLAKGKS